MPQKISAIRAFVLQQENSSNLVIFGPFYFDPFASENWRAERSFTGVINLKTKLSVKQKKNHKTHEYFVILTYMY